MSRASLSCSDLLPRAKKGVCTMCTPWAADSSVQVPDWPGFRMFPGVLSVCWGRNAVRVPPRAQCFRRSEAHWASGPVCNVNTLLRGVFMTVCWSRRVCRWQFLWPGSPFLGRGDFLPCCYFIARPGRSNMTCFELGEWDRDGLFSLFVVSCMFMVVVVGYRMTKELIRLLVQV